LADLGGDLGNVVEAGGPDEARPGIDQRNAEDAELSAEITGPHAERRLEKLPRTPVEELEEAAVEHDAGRIAMAPFGDELQAVDEICHRVPIALPGGKKRVFSPEVNRPDASGRGARSLDAHLSPFGGCFASPAGIL